MATLLDSIRELFFGPPPKPESTTHRTAVSHSAPTRRMTSPVRSSKAATKQTGRPVPTRRQPTTPAGLGITDNSHSDVTVVSSGADDADQYLARLQVKINKLAEEFASGAINRDQFQQLFDHYQKERRAIVNWKENTSSAGNWQDISSEGKSIVIRSRHSAKVVGYAVYANESGMPLSTIGEFELDPELAVPMLSSYRAATKEIFGGEISSTEIEGGRWLCFVPGEQTTLLALFSNEPADRQMKIIEDLHQLFETANRRHLAAPPYDPNELAFPHSSFLGRLQ